MAPYPPTLGVLLAGGLARRIGGGDKPLRRLDGGSSLVEHAAKRLAPQCESLILNANGDPSRFQFMGLPVVPDSVPDHPGPLAGILAALDWAAAHKPGVAWVVSVPGDTPFIPQDLVARLHEERAAAGCPLACAASGARVHFAVGLWPVHLRHDLHRALTEDNVRRLADWANLQGYAAASWPADPIDPFFNINTNSDLAQADKLMRLMDRSMLELDLSGLKCPLPVLRTRKALMSLTAGDRLHVICTDPLAGIDVPNLIRETGDILEEQMQEGTKVSFLIRKAK